jgi:hypothetical protein
MLSALEEESPSCDGCHLVPKAFLPDGRSNVGTEKCHVFGLTFLDP